MAWGWPGLYGLIAGTIVAASITSATLWIWSSSALGEMGHERHARAAEGW